MLGRTFFSLGILLASVVPFAMTIDNRISQHHHHHHHHHENFPHHWKDDDACPEDVVEWRTRSGEIIFTGTVRKIVVADESSDDRYRDDDFDYRHETSKMAFEENVLEMEEGMRLSAVVEVKRVLRGGQALNRLPENGGHVIKSVNQLKVGKKLVVVEDLNNPEFCHPYEAIKVNDTRIFFALKSQTGNLRLNSSLVKFSLRNVEIFEVAVKELLYLQKSKNKLYEKSMKMHLSGRPNTERFMNFCLNVTCDGGSTCVLLFNGTEITTRCKCQDFCTTEKQHGTIADDDNDPVCGVDGKDYRRKCELENVNCREKRNIKVKFPGKCDPCSSFLCQDRQTCVLDHVTRQPLCRCGFSCPMNFDPVCGNDGRTYINECTLKEIACANGDDVWVLYKGECSSGENPCFDHKCGPHETCKVDHSNAPYCTCPSSCPPIYIPICGSDGKTYDSDCHLKMEACLFRVSLFPRHPGMCKESSALTSSESTAPHNPCNNFECPQSSKCIVSNNLPTCECISCMDEYKPVCGSDGVTYDSECLVKFINCKEKTNTTISHHSACDACLKKKCDFFSKCVTDADGRAHCVCDHSCSNRTGDKICASDKTTYGNECEMEQASCILQKEISVSSRGPCDSCDDVTCKFGGMCRQGKCTCDFECEPSDPVCGEDGISYPNVCLMRRSTCKRGVQVKVSHPGRCQSEVDKVEESSGSGDSPEHTIPMCDKNNCKYGGVCAPTIGGGKVCVCKFDCEALRAPVCGSDGKTYGSECLLKEEACERQYSVRVQSPGPCEGLDFEVCDGRPPLRNPLTNLEYSCHNDVCPPSSYCHKQGSSAKCCLEESSIKSCLHSANGCCPDGKIWKECEPSCQCSPVGSLARTCQPDTGECRCRPGVGGPMCDRCNPGYWGFPKIAEGNEGCLPCACSKLGSLRADCDQVTGRCLCKPGALGQKCDFCPSGQKLEECSDEMNLTTNPAASTNVEKIELSNDLFTDLPETGSKIPSLFGNSFFLLKLPAHFSKSLSVSMKFMATKEDGILFFVGHKEGKRRDYYFIVLRMRHVVFRYDLGSGPALISSHRKVKLGTWHHLEATRFETEGTLKLDDGPQQTGFSRDPLKFLDLENGYAFVGDVANRTNHVTQLTGVSHGFHGCIEYLSVKTHDQLVSLNFKETRLEKNIVEKHGIGDCGECTKTRCQNEGVCNINQPGICTCSPGFLGQLCELENACLSDPCRNSGTCVSVGNATFHCKCRIGFRGNVCEIDMKRHARYTPITMPEFHKNSFISASLLDNVSLVRSFSTEIWFLSYESSGVLLSAMSNDSSSYLVVLLRSGVVQLIFKIKKTSEILTSPKLIKASKWNKVLVTMTNGEGLLMVNNDHPVMRHPPLTNKYKEILDKNKWPTAWNIRFGNIHGALDGVVKNMSAFHGAFQRIYINGVRMSDILQPVTFRNGNTLLRVLGQQHVTQYDGFPCPSSKNPCEPQGVCISVLNEHLCRCHGRNVTLKSCQIKSTPLYFGGGEALSYQTKTEGIRKIQIRFKSRLEDGELFQLEDEVEQFRAFIRKHFLLVEVELNERSSVLISNSNVSDGTWHKVLIENDQHNVRLYVDGVMADDAKVVPLRHFSSSPGTLWIGGSDSYFVGCIESVWLNNIRMDLWKDRDQKHVRLTPCV